MRSLCILALAACTSCISFNYNHRSIGEPFDEDALECVVAGTCDLATCLDALGAPELVWPAEDGMIHIAYAWIDSDDWGISASWSFDRLVSLKTSFDGAYFEAQSVVLAFDHELRLDHISRGYLFDLVPSAQNSTAARRMMRRAPR